MEAKISHHGYIPLCKEYLRQLKRAPHVLEVGVERGVMLMTIATFLTRTHENFVVLGIDIMIQEQVQIMVNYLDRLPTQRVFLSQANSLDALPKLGTKFDLVLIDGDHNYYTVTQELQHLDKLTNPDSLVIIDDYNGRWAEKDLWYAERPEYVTNTIATAPVQCTKHGVKAAVDEYLLSHPHWTGSCPIGGEPILLTRSMNT